MSHYDIYFDQQYGGGGRGVHNVFVGTRGQRGHGIGSFLGGLFRKALPFITKSARAVGKEALKAGVNMLNDVTDNNMSLQESFQNRMGESANNLKRKATTKLIDLMEGSGYKRLPYNRLAQLRRNTRTRKKSTTRRTKKRKLKRLVKKRDSKKRKIKSQKKKKKVVKKKRKTTSKKRKIQDIFN